MRLRLDGGDGDQSYFSEPLDLEVVERDCFKTETIHGPAKLALVLSGCHSGEYVALTSRVLSSIDDQLADRGFASVVVMVVKNPGSGFEPTQEQLDAIGMSFADLVD